MVDFAELDKHNLRSRTISARMTESRMQDGYRRDQRKRSP